MLISDLPVMSLLKERMKWSAERHRVLAQNIANANTPRYRAQDLKQLDFRSTLRNQPQRLPLMRTAAAHYESSHASGDYRVIPDPDAYEVSPDGNSVVLEEQIVKMGENTQDQRMATSLHRKITQLYRVALGRSGG